MVAARITSFFKRLRLFAWALAAIGVSSNLLPAETTPNARPVAPAVMALVPVRNATIWETSGKYHHDDRKFAIENAVEISETSFGQ